MPPAKHKNNMEKNIQREREEFCVLFMTNIQRKTSVMLFEAGWCNSQAEISVLGPFRDKNVVR